MRPIAQSVVITAAWQRMTSAYRRPIGRSSASEDVGIAASIVRGATDSPLQRRDVLRGGLELVLREDANPMAAQQRRRHALARHGRARERPVVHLHAAAGRAALLQDRDARAGALRLIERRRGAGLELARDVASVAGPHTTQAADPHDLGRRPRNAEAAE